MAGEGWQQTKVDEMIRHGVLALNDGYRVRNVELGPVGIPFVRGGDIGDGGINTAVEDHIRPEFTDRVQSKLTRPFDVAFITKGTVGRVGMVRPNQPPSVFAPQVCYWRSLDSEQLEPRFLFYLLTSAEFQANLDAVKTHGSMAADYVSMTDQRDFRLTFPPIREQKAIAAVLGALDDKIELNRQMNATLEAMARALFQSWFVDFDPVRAKLDGRPPAALDPATAALFPEHLEDSTLGHIPKGWTCGTIGELGARILDKVARQSEWALEPLIDLSRMPQRSVALAEWGLGAELTTSVTRFIPKDILFGAIRPYFHKVGIAPVHGVTNVSVFVIRGKQAFDWAFLAVLCSLDSTVEFATRVSKGTKMPVVGWPDFANYPVVVPPREIRRAFANVVAPLYDRIIANLHQSQTLATLRDTLLPKLLSGEIGLGEITAAL